MGLPSDFQVLLLIFGGYIACVIIYYGFCLIEAGYLFVGRIVLVGGFVVLLTDFGWAACGSPILFWSRLYNILLGWW